MTMSRQAPPAAPHPSRYNPRPGNVTRQRKPNRRPLGWHAGNLAATAVCNAGEWYLRRHPA
jgi:hypothetical protein